jgi:outer membrane receptor protein involved in Fe transport
MLKNAGKSASKGVELSLKTKGVLGIEPILSYGYTHATFIEHVVDSATDHSGNYIPYVPRHTASVMLNKTFHVKRGGWLDKIVANVAYTGAGKIFWNEENSHAQDYYSILSAKVSLVNKFLRFEVWGKNLLNTSYESFYFEALGNKYVQPGRPLQFGANIAVSF